MSVERRTIKCTDYFLLAFPAHLMILKLVVHTAVHAVDMND